MRDNYGDLITVIASSAATVLVTFEDNENLIDMSLPPKKARKLAQKLLLAAQEIECSQRLGALNRD